MVRGGGRTLGLEVAENRIARVLGKRQSRLAPSLADDVEAPLPPVDVAKPEPDNIASAQSETCEQKQHGAIAQRHGAGAIARLEDALHVVIWEVAGELCQPPGGDPGHRLDEVHRAATLRGEVAQEATDTRRHATGRGRRVPLDVLEYEPAHACGSEPRRIVGHGTQQRLDHPKSVGDRRRSQTALVAHPRAVLGRRRRMHRTQRRSGHDTCLAEVAQERSGPERCAPVTVVAGGAAPATAPAAGQVPHEASE